ncbi:DUF2569 domain-containing protein [Kosakonia sp. BYX6]|uniref:DUF2569 domain-containing protein n=1 Tax=Kosakonia calanthes TaxID=3139408 RepID=A0ABZ3B3P6_9ENTR
MGVCIQCDNDALKGSDFCAACEEREFKKIRGWLYLPALGLVLTILANMMAVNFSVRLLMEHYDVISNTRKAIVLFELFAFIGMFVYAIFVSSLFFRKKRQLPRHYMVLVATGTAFVAIDLLLGHQYLDVPYVYDTVKPLVRNVLSACIWIPYFIVSERVKRTFVR